MRIRKRIREHIRKLRFELRGARGRHTPSRDARGAAPDAGLACLLLVLALAYPCAACAGAGLAARAEVRRFISEMVARHGFKRAELSGVFARVHHQPQVLRAIAPPPATAPRSWRAYRERFVNARRIEAGIAFQELNAEVLRRASARFHVPAPVIAAIIGVETVYGRNQGAFRIIDALSTLAFDYPPRAQYFRSELENYLLHARETGIDVMASRGSYAGAMGIPQFMPASYRRYGLDFDGDGRRDLEGSSADAIGSVGNYLLAHGWRGELPIAAPARVSGENHRLLLSAGIRPIWRVRDLAAFGVAIEAALDPELACALIELPSPGEQPQYWVVMENFYVITRYNPSSFYAASVLELARTLAAHGGESIDPLPSRTPHAVRNAAPVAASAGAESALRD